MLDALVVGGGPAGAAFATILARQGKDVVIVEGTRFPRPHIGESLLAASTPLLDSLGLLPSMASFLPKRGAVFAWGQGHDEVVLKMPPPGIAYEVDRAAFDELLLRNARKQGVEIWEEHWAKQPIIERGRVTAVTVSAAGGGDSVDVRAKLVVDASGLFQFLPKKLRLPVDSYGPRRIAISQYVSGADRYRKPNEFDVISEASEDGWIWFIPVSEQTTSIGFVGDEIDMVGTPSEYLKRQLSSAPLVASLMGGSRETVKPKILKYSNHSVAASLWENGYVLLGDAAIFVDPLFSTGVHGALYSAAIAAGAVLEVLDDRADEPAMAEWYDRRFREHYGRIRSAIQLLYSLHPGPSRFWSTRHLANMSTDAANELIEAVGAAGMDFFKQSAQTGSLVLPAALEALLEEIVVEAPPVKIHDNSVLRLGNQITVKSDFRPRSDGYLEPTRVLTHRRGRTRDLEYPVGSTANQFISAVDGRSTFLDISTQMEATAIHRLRALAATLAGGGLLEVDTTQQSGFSQR